LSVVRLGSQRERISQRTDLTENRLATANGSQSSSAQNPDVFPFLEENGQTPDQFTQTPLNTRRPTLGRFRHVSPHDATLPVRHQPDDEPPPVPGDRSSETSDNRPLKTDD